jgi:hypothetical protein
VRYQSLSDLDLAVSIGSDPAALQIEVVQRVLVCGAVSPREMPGWSRWPGHVTVTASQTYSAYLHVGSYSLYASVSNGTLNYATLVSVDVSGPLSLDVATSNAAMATIQATMTGLKSQSIVVHHRKLRGLLQRNHPDTGIASVYLPVGSFKASVDHSTVATMAAQQRFVRYVGELDFTMSTSRRNLIISTVMS